MIKKLFVFTLIIALPFSAMVQRMRPPFETPLEINALNGDVGAIAILLARGFDINRKDERGRTLLHYAADKGHISAINFLLDHHANPEIQDQCGYTSLHLAALHGHAIAVYALLDHHAHIESRSIQGRTPLHYAALYGHIPVIKILIARGACKNIRDSFDQIPLDSAFSSVHDGKQQELFVLLR